MTDLSANKFANNKILSTFVPDSRRFEHLGDTKVPYFIISFRRMIEKAKIEKLVEEHISGTGLFLVAVKISSTGKITVLADKKEGITIDECVSISRLIEKNFNRDEEDYELQVSSPGLEMPFLVIQQYYKNEGKRIEVTDSTGIKHTGILRNINEGGFELLSEIKTKTKGKSKSTETKELSFNYDQVKSARAVVTFK